MGEEALRHDPFAAENAPRAVPLTYPGARPPGSVVITDDELWEIRDRDGNRLSWRSDHVQRLANCRVALDIAQTDRLRLSHSALPHLSSVLEETQGVSPDARVPVLAIGSNAAPSQLRHKFRSSSVPLTVPSIRARVQGMRAGFCSFVSVLGYVPATLYPDAGAVTEMALQLLDDAQLRAVDETERIAYRRVWVDAPILLETGETLPGAYAYVAQGGVLADDAGPWVMAAQGEERPADVDPARWFADQRTLLERLCADRALAERIGATPEEITERRAPIADSHDALRAAGIVSEPNPLYDLEDRIGAAPRRYGALIRPEIVGMTGEDVVAVAGRSHDLVERTGRSVVRLGAEIDRLLHAPRNVELVSAALRDREGDRAPRVVATVYREPSPAAPPPAPQAVEVDHVLRMGMGVEAGEHLVIRAVEVDRARWADRLLGPPNSLSMRVTLADPSTTERDVCLMNRLSLELLGVHSGDYVVLEGGAGEDGKVRTIAVKAFDLPGEILAERQRVSSGTWGARFPGVRETLGVAPDIPIVFVDASTRARLGIGARQLATVRARPARLQQFGAELREMMLLLAVALIGLLTIIPNAVVAAVLFGLLLVATFALTMVKLRRRLSHPRQKA